MNLFRSRVVRRPLEAAILASGTAWAAAAEGSRVSLVLRREATVPPLAVRVEEEPLDFRYRPPQGQVCIGLPDDPFKTVVGSDGALYYDFGRWGPALYSLGAGRFGTRVALSLTGAGTNEPPRQRLWSARVPVVETVTREGLIELRQVVWAHADAGEEPAAWAPSRVDCLYAVVTNVGSVNATARLRLDAGTTLALRLEPDRRALRRMGGRVLCAFSRPCEPLHEEKVPSDAVVSRRPLSMHRGWAKPPAGVAECFRHVFVANREPLELDVPCSTGGAYVVAVGLIEGWHREPGLRPLRLEVEGGQAATVDCVRDRGFGQPLVVMLPARDTDGDGRLTVSVAVPPDVRERNAVLSGVWLFPDGAAPEESALLSGEAFGRAIAAVTADRPPITPRPVSVAWNLGELPPGGSADLFVVLPQGERAPETTDAIEPAGALARAVARWESASLPYGRIEVADPKVQELLDSCIRNIWQAREIKNGLPAFQVGPTAYRGLWIVDGAFLLEAVTLLGRAEEARRGIQYLLSFQRPDGGFMVIDQHWKETGIVLWAIMRHARLTGDRAWLSAVWSDVERAVAFVREMRRRASSESESPAAGLVPAGFIDGGLSGPSHNYANVYWTLIGLRAAVEGAKWLGREEQVEGWARELADFEAAFRRAAARDLRQDEQGNRYLPILMNAPDDLLPQKAQWAFLHAVYPGDVFGPDDPLARGTMAMLAARERQGLVHDTGWLGNGIWTYFGSFYAHAWLWLGHGAKAAATLYAFANHASPLLCWREEQRPVGESPGYVGDMPHNWASAEFIRLAVHLMILERGRELHLLEGMPPAWCRPGGMNRFREIPTAFGPVSLSVQVASDGQSALVELTPPVREPPSSIVLHLGSFGRAIEEVRVNGQSAGNSVAVPLQQSARIAIRFAGPR